MKRCVKIILLLSLFFAGCSSWSSPSGIVRSWLRFTEKGNTEEAMKLFSNKAMQARGAKLKTDVSSHVEEISKLQKAGRSFSVENLKEQITGETANVSLIYRAAENDSLHMWFDLIRENGSWKINGINDPETEPGTQTNDSAPIEILDPPPPPPPSPSPRKKK